MHSVLSEGPKIIIISAMMIANITEHLLHARNCAKDCTITIRSNSIMTL